MHGQIASVVEAGTKAMDKEALLNGPLSASRGSDRARSPRRRQGSRRSRSRTRSPVRDRRSPRRSPRQTNARSPPRSRPTSRKPEPHRGDGKVDPELRDVNDDPRVGTVLPCAIKAARGNTGRNTESFDPASTLVRPAMRIIVGPKKPVFDKPLKHDDVVVVPDFFCAEDDWSIYYKLIEEMRAAQSSGAAKSEWIPWAEGCHLISQNPTGSPTYEMVLRRASEYFNMKAGSQGTRFNWYRDSSDWKPFHHDSAAYNPGRARTQNITVGVSFGAERELAFLHAQNGSRIYFPQCNGMLFAFGRDVNINWKHGVNALAPQVFCGKGRISIILWGLAQDVIEEPESPALLTNDARNGFDNRGRANGDVCRDFQAGSCRFGDRCKFSHAARR
ncbi:hypothetical protein SPRG_04641 [Saprolegnia parasitica CBS 223.65]|uniref:C3H1-type domain-containing protein n=1 Tax=Saprolegnia parasitica (strain CBS 223.65) TaxID=695850 RepID=A0A067CNE2_SAPPC|nr:hypothetical protein SPRG_04641 [Saprolegnia parasitica CBS 223.65]KDO30740.1 hypothetical protein SPRG_04641 [Saprolegnia parasitica CBS 223.65]|eukprot:XP_012198440.1 hypothetical protein SPRG_04641 [Saprolegnia parasitica CBS 223.65]